MNGYIFEVKRFAVHDGPGLRTTLFLKGCPLHCPWCQNPEGLNVNIRLWYRERDCLKCSGCQAVCPQGALKLDDRVHIDVSRCTLCGRCVSACPTGALLPDGQAVSLDEAEEMLLKDMAFYEEGGITLSGGEVMAQWPFALALLERMHAKGVDTAIESCLWVKGEILEKFLPVTDHFIMDMKYFDGREHQRVLGVDNRLILENHLLLLRSGADVLVRTPLIPGYTATEENIRAIARHLAQTDPHARYELLNFNPLCRSKYSALEQDYPIQGGPLSPEEMDFFYDILRQEGVQNIIRE